MIPRSDFAKASRSIISELELSDCVEGHLAMDGRYSLQLFIKRKDGSDYGCVNWLCAVVLKGRGGRCLCLSR